MTLYSTIFEEFKDRISDYDLPQYKQELQDDFLLSYLRKAITKFKRICKNDLTLLNDDKNGFALDLANEEIDILTEWMVYFWIKPYRNNNEFMKIALNTKDYTLLSKSNQLNAIQAIYKDSYKTARSLMNEYSYLNGSFSTLKPR